MRFPRQEKRERLLHADAKLHLCSGVSESNLGNIAMSCVSVRQIADRSDEFLVNDT